MRRHNIAMHIGKEMYVLNQTIFKQALEKAGFESAKELAQKLNIHRNTIGAYIQGKSVLPEAFEQIIRAVHLNPGEALMDIQPKPGERDIIKIIPLIDLLSKENKNCSFFLFGSRAKQTSTKYSDYDLGVFSTKGLTHKEFRELVKVKESFEEDIPYFIDVVNLNSANNVFLASIADSLILLSGNYGDLLEIKTAVSKNGRRNKERS